MGSINGTHIREHWERLYSSQPEEDLSWYEATPSISLDLLLTPSLKKDGAILDVGGGCSRLVDALLDRGFVNVSVLDVVESALKMSQERLGDRAAQVQWIAADITHWYTDTKYNAWHDRAAFHFLIEEAARRAYVEAMERTLLPGAIVVIGTFSTLGPDRCSGLPVMRYSAQSLAAELGDGFRWTATRKLEHVTPSGEMQHFQFSRFVRE
jgi:ubiquinone/menaquinone biosynthesis C-methylase UbiE